MKKCMILFLSVLNLGLFSFTITANQPLDGFEQMQLEEALRRSAEEAKAALRRSVEEAEAAEAAEAQLLARAIELSLQSDPTIRSAAVDDDDNKPCADCGGVGDACTCSADAAPAGVISASSARVIDESACPLCKKSGAGCAGNDTEESKGDFKLYYATKENPSEYIDLVRELKREKCENRGNRLKEVLSNVFARKSTLYEKFLTNRPEEINLFRRHKGLGTFFNDLRFRFFNSVLSTLSIADLKEIKEFLNGKDFYRKNDFLSKIDFLIKTREDNRVFPVKKRDFERGFARFKLNDFIKRNPAKPGEWTHDAQKRRKVARAQLMGQIGRRYREREEQGMAEKDRIKGALRANNKRVNEFITLMKKLPERDKRNKLIARAEALLKAASDFDVSDDGEDSIYSWWFTDYQAMKEHNAKVIPALNALYQEAKVARLIK